MLATSGTSAGIATRIAAISSSDSGASMKTASAPASAKARARRMASSSPSGARASVRAVTWKSVPRRRSRAARSFGRYSSSSTTRFRAM